MAIISQSAGDFMENFIFSISATLPIFIVMLASFIFYKKGLLSDQFINGADRLVFRVLLPIMLFQDTAKQNISELFDPTFFTFCVISTIAMFVAIWVLSEIFIRDKTIVSAFTQGCFRSNIAILGIAFAQNIYGSSGLVSIAIVASVPLYNVLSVVLLTVRSNDKSIGKDMNIVRSCIKGVVTNPLIIAILSGVLWSILSIPMPNILDKSLAYFGGMATPLALVSLGGGFKAQEALNKLKPTLAATFVKLLLLPTIFLVIGYSLGFRNEAIVTILAIFGTPTAISSYIMSKNMGGDAVLSSSIVMSTTALSALSITLFLFILKTINLI